MSDPEHQGDEPSEPGVARRDGDVEITEFGGLRVAHLPDEDDAWISGWVDVPR
ncbi:hypothetical protein [Haloarcula litorea]|uniref:hypothetical protein n=1 Tax=Haloarcula litorea TaxID=3032579 RepID=UPI0023E8A4AF|nr:hypothetical protein [Halomicroarcula sp. GDY20]